MHTLDRWRSAVAALGMAVVAAGSLATGAQAAALTAVFHGTQSHCVDGVSNHTLTSLNLYDGPTLVEIASTLTRNGATGRFHGCFSTAFVDHDLTLIATSNFGTVQYIVPNLTVSIDRVTDKVSGHAHANHSVSVRAYDCVVRVGYGCPHVATRSVRASAAGHYSADLTSAFDLRGTDKVKVTDTSAHGDTWLVTRYVPYVEAIMDFPQVNGVDQPRPAHHTADQEPPRRLDDGHRIGHRGSVREHPRDLGVGHPCRPAAPW